MNDKWKRMEYLKLFLEWEGKGKGKQAPSKIIFLTEYVKNNYLLYLTLIK